MLPKVQSPTPGAQGRSQLRPLLLAGPTAVGKSEIALLLAEQLNGYHLPGVRFQPITYKPYYFMFTGQVIGGVQIFFTDRATAPLTAINFYAFEALKKAASRDLFAEAVKAGRGFGMFDKVNGTDATRKALQAGTPAAEIVASWKPGEEAFRKERKKYLLY